MSTASNVFQKLVIIFMLINIAVCPFVFLGMMFFPQAIAFLEPVVCPENMSMETEHSKGYDEDGSYTQSNVICVDNQREVDITWKVLLIMFGFPAFGVIVFFIMPTSGKEPEEITLDPGDSGY